jgi:hypothetical protein
MKGDVEWLSIHEVRINGWVFNFFQMRAVRNKWHFELGRDVVANQMLELGISDGQVCSVKPWDAGNVHGREFGSSMHHGGTNWKWFSFFVEPEDRYNAMIDEAYATYCLERAIQDSDPNIDT